MRFFKQVIRFSTLFVIFWITSASFFGIAIAGSSFNDVFNEQKFDEIKKFDEVTKFLKSEVENQQKEVIPKMKKMMGDTRKPDVPPPNLHDLHSMGQLGTGLTAAGKLKHDRIKKIIKNYESLLRGHNLLDLGSLVLDIFLKGTKDRVKNEYKSYYKMTDDTNLTKKDHDKIDAMAFARKYLDTEIRRSKRYKKQAELIIAERIDERKDILKKSGWQGNYGKVLKAKSRGEAYFNLLFLRKPYDCISKIIEYSSKINIRKYLGDTKKYFISHYTFNEGRRDEIDKIVKSIKSSMLVEGRIIDQEGKSPPRNILITAEVLGKKIPSSTEASGWFTFLFPIGYKNKKVIITINDTEYESYRGKWPIGEHQCNKWGKISLNKKSDKKPIACAEKFSTEINSVKKEINTIKDSVKETIAKCRLAKEVLDTLQKQVLEESDMFSEPITELKAYNIEDKIKNSEDAIKESEKTNKSIEEMTQKMKELLIKLEKLRLKICNETESLNDKKVQDSEHRKTFKWIQKNKNNLKLYLDQIKEYYKKIPTYNKNAKIILEPVEMDMLEKANEQVNSASKEVALVITKVEDELNNLKIISSRKQDTKTLLHTLISKGCEQKIANDMAILNNIDFSNCSDGIDDKIRNLRDSSSTWIRKKQDILKQIQKQFKTYAKNIKKIQSLNENRINTLFLSDDYFVRAKKLTLSGALCVYKAVRIMRNATANQPSHIVPIVRGQVGHIQLNKDKNTSVNICQSGMVRNADGECVCPKPLIANKAKNACVTCNERYPGAISASNSEKRCTCPKGTRKAKLHGIVKCVDKATMAEYCDKKLPGSIPGKKNCVCPEGREKSQKLNRCVNISDVNKTASLDQKKGNLVRIDVDVQTGKGQPECDLGIGQILSWDMQQASFTCMDVDKQTAKGKPECDLGIGQILSWDMQQASFTCMDIDEKTAKGQPECDLKIGQILSWDKQKGSWACIEESDNKIYLGDEKKPDQSGSLQIIYRVKSSGYTPHYGGGSFKNVGYHDVLLTLEEPATKQYIQSILNKIRDRYNTDVCSIAISAYPTGNRPPSIWKKFDVDVIRGPAPDLSNVKLENTWKSEGRDGPSLSELKKGKGCSK